MTAYFEPWFSYQHPIVQQLAFAIASPNIIRTLPSTLELQHSFQLHTDDFWQVLFKRYEPRLRQLDLNPHVLIDFLAPLKSTRLGLRFEYLIWFWLCDESYHHYKILGHSIQIIQGKNTLGELDFLVFNQETQLVEHWEVALKFYLAEADYSLKKWYGLNRTDTLSRKLNHFGRQQFQFQSAQNYPIQQRFAVLKGQLYLPIPQETREPNALPNWMNPTRQVGTWGHILQPDHFYRLQRQEWICPNIIHPSAAAIWWTDGLYFNAQKRQHYMYRRAPLIQPNDQNHNTIKTIHHMKLLNL